jgi:hypothetical protein
MKYHGLYLSLIYSDTPAFLSHLIKTSCIFPSGKSPHVRACNSPEVGHCIVSYRTTSAPSLPGTCPLSLLRTFLRHCSLLTQAPASNAGATSRSLEQRRHPADHTGYRFSEQRRRPPWTTAWLVQSRAFLTAPPRRSGAPATPKLANHSNLVALPSSSSTLKQSSLQAFNRWNRARLP